MNIDQIISAFNSQQVRCLLIGGVNFLLRHKPVLTFDVHQGLAEAACKR